MKNKKVCFKNIISKIGMVITVLLVVLIAYLVVSQIRGTVPFVFNKAVLNIVSGSMEPQIPTNSYILIKKTSPDDIKVGDIMTFYSRDSMIYGSPNTHLVIEIIGEGDDIKFRTKGLNESTNSIPDRILVEREDVIGVYRKNLPVITSITNFMSKKAIFFLLIIIPALSIITFQIKEVIEKSKQVKIEKLIEIEVERLKNQQNKNP